MKRTMVSSAIRFSLRVRWVQDYSCLLLYDKQFLLNIENLGLEPGKSSMALRAEEVSDFSFSFLS
jgi:hypothetical protein